MTQSFLLNVRRYPSALVKGLVQFRPPLSNVPIVVKHYVDRVQGFRPLIRVVRSTFKKQRRLAREREAQDRVRAAEADKVRVVAMSQRDKSDVVAQVLNYTTLGRDEGGDDAFWWKDKTKGDCYYRYYHAPVNQNLSVVLGLFYGIGTGETVIDLNQIDPQSLSFENEPTWDGERYAGVTTIVKYEGRPLLGNQVQTMLTGNGTRDLQRLQRGWALIYSDYCTGLKKPF